MSAKPWFRCWVNDLMGDPRVQAMDAMEFGAYWLLICTQWKTHTIPDPEAGEVQRRRVQRLCRVADEDWDRVWQAIGPCFDPVEGEPGYIHSPRQTEELDHALSKSAKARSSVRKRWERSTNAVRSLYDGDTSQSQSQDVGEPTSESPSSPGEKAWPDEVVELVDELAEMVLTRHPRFGKRVEKSRKGWHRHIDLMLRRDGVAATEATKVIRWLRDDAPTSASGFCWGSVIQSASKLREKYPDVSEQWERWSRGPGSGPSKPADRGEYPDGPVST